MKSKVKRVKGWATVMPNWKGGSFTHAFFYKEEAEEQAKKNIMHKKVVPCTIEYKLPTPTNKK